MFSGENMVEQNFQICFNLEWFFTLICWYYQKGTLQEATFWKIFVPEAIPGVGGLVLDYLRLIKFNTTTYSLLYDTSYYFPPEATLINNDKLLWSDCSLQKSASKYWRMQFSFSTLHIYEKRINKLGQSCAKLRSIWG